MHRLPNPRPRRLPISGRPGRSLRPYLSSLSLVAALSVACTLPAATFAAQRLHRAPGHHEIVLKDDVGDTVRLPAPATRIVTLAPSDTQIALSLGLRSDLVGVDTDSLAYMAPPYARLVRGLPSIGDTYPAPSLERIVKARPDLILTASLVADTARIQKLGIPVLVLNPESLAGIEHDVLLVGDATGRTARARAVDRSLAQGVAALRARIRRAKTHPTVYLEVGQNPLYSVGPGSYVDSLLKMLGAHNVIDRVSRVSYPQVSSETVVTQDPSVIILDETGVTPAQIGRRPGWSRIAAVLHHRVYANVNVNALSQPGPSVLTALKELARDLYPRLFPPR